MFPKVFSFRVPNSWVRDEGNHARIFGLEFPKSNAPRKIIKIIKRRKIILRLKQKKDLMILVILMDRYLILVDLNLLEPQILNHPMQMLLVSVLLMIN